MDKPAIAGVIVGMVCILIGIGIRGGGVDLPLFWNVPSLFITFGGAIAATLLNFPSRQLKDATKALKLVFKRRKIEDTISVIIPVIVRLAEKARRRGLLALEADLENINDDFLKKGMQYVIDGTDRDLLRLMLETEMSFLEERHKKVQEVYVSFGTYCPAFGMIGTVIGLILMLRRITEASAIGEGMAVALLTTLYGALAAYWFLLPMAGKLKMLMMDELLTKEIILEGILSIQAGESPRIVADRLQTYLPPALRQAAEFKREEAAPAP
ncbi:motility protein A [Candidatus Desantisbacteria bacterium CG_4_10_14_0_8_um_filter_48_22]|uniref:Motility protein A n=1 Tax=Candidatus Desantisbacteria bacterium CG_4_10_14_0_8_um_filter_48_22 TaxID=1974543 RepID=A0A2M7S8G7_9BACT|nr:MAG: motility protein A [Candidatus Desantisbacteria bacterium CG_4_10_14_0_8_um_filter_48_22]